MVQILAPVYEHKSSHFQEQRNTLQAGRVRWSLRTFVTRSNFVAAAIVQNMAAAQFRIVRASSLLGQRCCALELLVSASFAFAFTAALVSSFGWASQKIRPSRRSSASTAWKKNKALWAAIKTRKRPIKSQKREPQNWCRKLRVCTLKCTWRQKPKALGGPRRAFQMISCFWTLLAFEMSFSRLWPWN